MENLDTNNLYNFEEFGEERKYQDMRRRVHISELQRMVENAQGQLNKGESAIFDAEVNQLIQDFLILLDNTIEIERIIAHQELELFHTEILKICIQFQAQVRGLMDLMVKGASYEVLKNAGEKVQSVKECNDDLIAKNKFRMQMLIDKFKSSCLAYGGERALDPEDLTPSGDPKKQ